MGRVLIRTLVCVPFAIIASVLSLSSVLMFVSLPLTNSADRSTTLGVAIALLLMAILLGWPAVALWSGTNSNAKTERRLRAWMNEPLVQVTRGIVRQHVHVLATERRSRLVPDKYGVVDPASWAGEIELFTARVAWPHVAVTMHATRFRNSIRRVGNLLLRPSSDAPQDVFRAVVRSLVEAEVDAHEASFSATTQLREPYATPQQFEEYCANELRNVGWDARVIGRSGDQGADVMAIRGGIVAVLQCKFFSQPVGNGAIQEAFSGKAFHRAQFAAVVSTSGFTKAARALAAQTGVHMLSPEGLRSFLSNTNEPGSNE